MNFEQRKPLFFAWTRSFWAAVLTALLTIQQTGEPMVEAIGTGIALIFGGDVDQYVSTGRALLPLLTLGFAMHQRSGAARPWTVDPRALK